MRLMTLIPAALLLASLPASANDTFSYVCSTEVSCDGLFGHVVTKRFMAKYPAKAWSISVVSDTYSLSRSVVSHATVGVIPKTKGNDWYYAPNNRFSQISTHDGALNAYETKDLERKVIIKAVEAMMASCQDKPDCDLTK